MRWRASEVFLSQLVSRMMTDDEPQIAQAGCSASFAGLRPRRMATYDTPINIPYQPC
jgi:hypothetical protein